MTEVNTFYGPGPILSSIGINLLDLICMEDTALYLYPQLRKPCENLFVTIAKRDTGESVVSERLDRSASLFSRIPVPSGIKLVLLQDIDK